ncbi:50S ribosomal protein L25 [Chlamydia trachomatis]|nr:50S ribosomal protein L25 [Chlamydia trachomatis]
MEVRSNANAVFTIAVNGKKQLALVKDIQVNPLSRTIEHIDLLRVKADQKVEVEVPLEVKNEPKDGAIATLEIMHLLVETPATDIPEMIEIDVDGLEDGTVLRVADLKLPEGVTTAVDPEENVVIVAIPKAEELPEAEAGADGEAPAEAAE